MDSLLLLVVGFVIGWWVHRISVLNRILKNPDSLIQMLEKYKTAKIEAENAGDDTYRNIRVEKHDNQVYLFAEDTNEFLAQAETLQEALVLVETRFPAQSFKGHLNKEQADALGLKV